MNFRTLVAAVISLNPSSQVAAGQPHSAAGTRYCGSGSQSRSRWPEES